MAQILIGTSGWTSPSWKGTFYPENLPSTRFLEFYTNRFPTTEVNYSFYHLPKLSTYEKWAAQVPEGFVFAVKASRFITHTQRLQSVKEPQWRERSLLGRSAFGWFLSSVMRHGSWISESAP